MMQCVHIANVILGQIVSPILNSKEIRKKKSLIEVVFEQPKSIKEIMIWLLLRYPDRPIFRRHKTFCTI